MEKELKTRQICFFFIAFLPVLKLFSLPSVLASACAEDMWISTLISLILDLLTVSAVLFACKKTNTDFYGLLEKSLGKVGSKIVLGFYTAVFLLKAVLPIYQQKSFVDISLYETFPSILNFMPFFIASFPLDVFLYAFVARMRFLLKLNLSFGIYTFGVRRAISFLNE